MATRAGDGDSITLLVTCVGRRVELLQAFRAAALRLGLRLRIVGADITPTAPALVCADARVLTPPATEPGYVPALLEAVRRERAAALIPTIDTDLLVIAEHRTAFEAAGCMPLIAEPGLIRTCRDKVRTFQFLKQAGFDTPATYLPDEFRALDAPRYPYFIKPRFGSASKWVHKLDDPDDARYFLGKVRDAIVQEFVAGVEHTLDVYVGLTGEPRCVVPRRRWQVRDGEVSKGVVIKDRAIMDAGRRVVQALGRSPRGVVTIQCIVTADQRIRFIEINPRFGGGAPLGIAAGADYPAWLLRELRGDDPQPQFDGFQHGLCMSRYDWSMFMPLGDDLTSRIEPPLWDFPTFP